MVLIFVIGLTTQSTSPTIGKHEGVDIALSPEEITALRKKVAKSVGEIGLKATYEELKTQYPPVDSIVAHAIAHYFGELVYDELGLEGIHTCGNEFTNGCYHGVVNQAIAQEGHQTISKAIDICNNFETGRTGCQHIIGHSFLEYYGQDKLLEVLNMCLDVSSNITPTGCVGGAFMQYYFPSMSPPDSLSPLLKKNPPAQLSGEKHN